MADKKNLIKITTPKGVAVFPNLNKPDTKFNKDGEYTCRVRMTVEEGQDLMTQLDALVDAKFEEVKAANGGKDFKIVKGKKKEIKRNDPYTLEVDDSGTPNGMVTFNPTMKAQYTDSKTGDVVKNKPKLFDAQGNPLPPNVQIWGGSEVKVAAIVNQYDSEFGVGVKLRLQAVQVIKLRTSGGGDASSFGFGKEDGYESEASQEGFSSDEDGEDNNSVDDDEF